MAEWAAVPEPAFSVPIHGLSADSRAVTPGDLFVALTGARTDGHAHAAAAAARGAAAGLAERPLAIADPVVVVPSTTKVLSPLAARSHDCPSRAR